MKRAFLALVATVALAAAAGSQASAGVTTHVTFDNRSDAWVFVTIDFNHAVLKNKNLASYCVAPGNGLDGNYSLEDEATHIRFQVNKAGCKHPFVLDSKINFSPRVSYGIAGANGSYKTTFVRP